MRTNYAVMAVLVMLLLLAGCSGGFSVSTARISDASMAEGVTSDTHEPVQKTDVFSTSTPVIYACGLVSNAPSETKIESRWFYEDEFITSAEIQVSGTQTFSFSLEPPDAGWPEGSYSVKLFLDGKEDRMLNFTVR
jgi:hypothetical protein